MKNNLKELIQEKISQLQFSLSEEDNKKKVLFVVFGILLVLIIILIFILCSSPKEKELLPKVNYEITDYLYSPTSPEISSDYMFSRTPKKSWTEEEANNYITLPTEKMLDDLQNANDKLIKDILEASP